MELNGIKLNYTDTHPSRVPPVYITETFCVFFLFAFKGALCKNFSENILKH